MLIMILIDWAFGNSNGFQIKTYFDLSTFLRDKSNCSLYMEFAPNHLLDRKLFIRLSPHRLSCVSVESTPVLV